MGRWLASFVLGYSCISSNALAQSPRERDAVRHVCAAGVDSAVAKAQRGQGDAAVVAAEVLPNPAVVVEHQRSVSGAADRETIVGISVPLGIGGQRWLLQDAARARRAHLALDAQSGLFDAALSFREAYAVAAVAQGRVEILTRNQATLDALTSSIQKLARAGEAAGYDQLRQATYARLHRQAVESATIDAEAARIQLLAWVDRPAITQLEPSEVLTASRTHRAASGAGNTLDVRGLEARAQADDLAARAARRRAVPDVLLFGAYRSVATGGETGHGLAVSLEIPITLFDHGQGDAQRATSDAQLARASAQRLRKRQQAAELAARASLERLELNAAEARTASRDASAMRDKATELYSAGEASITELLEAHRVAEEAQLAELTLAERVALTRLALMRAAGTMFDAELDQHCRGAVR